MDALVVACGRAARWWGVGPPPCTPQGGGGGDTSAWREVPAIPDKSDLDPLLATGPDRVVVVGTDASLAAVVLRLLRTERLNAAVGFVPVAQSIVARLWNLPAERDAALAFAVAGDARAIPLVRDDGGGVLMGLGRLAPVAGEAYCDDQLALRGRARAIEVTPDPAGVAGRVVQSGLFGKRASQFTGRAFQIGCEPTTAVHDGITHPRPVRRWTWYRHTEDLRAISLPG